MAWIAAAIGAAATYYSSRQQNKASNKIGKQQDRLYGIQADTAEKLQPYTLDFYKKAGEAFDPALNYYKTLASGDTSRIYSTLAPDLAAIGQRYRSLIGASSELNQRGGMSASYAAELPFQAAREKGALVSGARAGAYGNLAKMAGLATDIGSGAAGLSTNAAAGAGNMLNNAWMASLLQSGRSAEAYGQLGEAISKMFGRNKGGGWYIGNQSGPG